MSKSGRKGHSPEIKKAIFQEFQNTEVDIRELAQKYHVSYATIKWWFSQDPELRKISKERTNKFRKRPGPYSPAQRVQAVETFIKSGMYLDEFAKVYGVGQSTLSVWTKIYETEGPQGLEKADLYDKKSKRGRKRLPGPIRDEIIHIKKKNPRFGLRKVRDFLFRFRGVKVSHKTVGSTLKAEGIESPQRTRKKRRAKVKTLFFERARPMELWQSDITSFALTRHSLKVYLTVFMDDNSRYIVAWNLQLRQTLELVVDALLNGIQRFGKPEEVLTDQGRQYFAWRGKSEFEKVLNKEGIKHVVARSHHPQTLGKCERFWETVRTEFWDILKPQELTEAQQRLENYINYYNHFRPHQGLGGMTPADRFFGAESEVRKKIEESVNQNELRASLKEPPRMPVFLIGQIGDQQISMHGEDGRLIVNTPDGESKLINFQKFGHFKNGGENENRQSNSSGNTGSNGERGAETTAPARVQSEAQLQYAPSTGTVGKGALDASNLRRTDESACNRGLDHGILDGTNHQGGSGQAPSSPLGEGHAALPESDLGDVGGTSTPVTERINHSDQSQSEPKSTDEENCRAREENRDARQTHCNPTGDARMPGGEDTTPGHNDDKSAAEETWQAKEEPDTDGRSK